MDADRLRRVAASLEWYALRISPLKEFAAQHLIDARGFTTYLPIEVKWRRRNKYTRKKEERCYALLPRYLFVGFEPGTARFFDVVNMPVVDCSRVVDQVRRVFSLFNLPVVNGIVGLDGNPARIPGDGLHRLMRVYPDGLKRPKAERHMPTNREFKAGDMVRVIDGAFDGMTVPVVAVQSNGRGRVLLELFGATQEVEIDMALLEKE